MRNSLKTLLLVAAGIAVSVSAGVWAISGGGFPSFPSFSAIGVNVAAPAAGQLSMRATSGALAQLIVKGVGSVNAVGVCESDTAALCSGTSAAGDSVLFGSNTLRIETTSGSDYMTFSGGNTIAVPGTVTTVPWSGKASGTVTLAGSGNCTVGSISATFHYSVAGNTVTMNQTSGITTCTTTSSAGVAITGTGFAGAPTQPTSTQVVPVVAVCNLTVQAGTLQIQSSGAWSLGFPGCGSASSDGFVTNAGFTYVTN